MSDITMEAAKLIDMFPESEQKLAYAFIKALVFAWDPDFIKLTPEEAKQLKKAEASGFVRADEIDWSQIGQ